MRRAHTGWLIVGVIAPAMLCAQTDSGAQSSPEAVLKRGVHLTSVSVYSGYYSWGAPVGFEMPTQSPFLGASAMAGISASVGSTSSGEKGSITWSYNPSYFRRVYSEMDRSAGKDSVSHRFSANWSRKLGARWGLTASVAGLVSSLEQTYFNPGSLTGLVSVPTTFEGLAAAVLSGKIDDAQLAAALTGASLRQSTGDVFWYGDRIFSGSSSLGISWVPTGRTSVSAIFSGSRAQRLTDGAAAAQTLGRPALPQVTNAGAALSWSYSVSPRTSISVQAASNRSFSSLQPVYASDIRFSVGRTLSPRFFVQANAGAGTMTYLRKVERTPEPVQYVYGATLGMKNGAHTFIISYDQSLADQHGLGSTATRTGSGAWRWRRPGSAWTVSASATYQELISLQLPNTRVWQAGAGLSRSLGRQVFWGVQYIYLELPFQIATAGANNAENGIMMSLTWSPPQFR